MSQNSDLGVDIIIAKISISFLHIFHVSISLQFVIMFSYWL